MEEAFPEAMVRFPLELVRAIECIPDTNDRHGLAAAIMARADVIVTQNTKHFPQGCLEKFGVHSQTPDEFLIRQYQLDPQLVLDKLDDQGAGISQARAIVVATKCGSWILQGCGASRPIAIKRLNRKVREGKPRRKAAKAAKKHTSFLRFRIKPPSANAAAGRSGGLRGDDRKASPLRTLRFTKEESELQTPLSLTSA